MVMYESWLSVAGTAMGGITATQAGFTLALLLTMVIIVIVLIATKGKEAKWTVPISALIPIILFTFWGWYPAYTGGLLGLVVALFIAGIMSGKI